MRCEPSGPFSQIILEFCAQYDQLKTLPTGVKIAIRQIGDTTYRWLLKKRESKSTKNIIEVHQRKLNKNIFDEQSYIVFIDSF
jgi:hypothetical protein